MTTNFPNGLTTADPNTTLGTFILPDYTKLHYFFDDFVNFDSSLWSFTNIGGGSLALDATLRSGALDFFGNVEDARSIVQTEQPTFTLEAGKQLWVKARVILDEAPDEIDWIFGLQVPGTDAFTSPDGVYLERLNNSSVFLETRGMTPIQTSLPVSSFSAVTTDVGFHFDGIETLTVFVDDVSIKKVVITSALLSGALAITMAHRTSSITPTEFDFDYIFFAKER